MTQNPDYYFYNKEGYFLKWMDIALTLVERFGKPDECFMIGSEFRASSKLDIDILNCDLYGKSYIRFGRNTYMMKKTVAPELPRMRHVGEHFWNPIFLFKFGRIGEIEQDGNYLLAPASKIQPYPTDSCWMELALKNPFERKDEPYGKMHKISLNQNKPDDVVIEAYNFCLNDFRKNGMKLSGNEWVTSYLDN